MRVNSRVTFSTHPRDVLTLGIDHDLVAPFPDVLLAVVIVAFNVFKFKCKEDQKFRTKLTDKLASRPDNDRFSIVPPHNAQLRVAH